VVAADLEGSEAAAAAATMTWPVPDADLKSAENGRKGRGASDREMEKQSSRAVCLLGCEGAQLFFGSKVFWRTVCASWANGAKMWELLRCNFFNLVFLKNNFHK
jgi:hypothetical protein